MNRNRPTAGRPAVSSVAKIAVGLLMVGCVLAGAPARAAGEFPFERMLMLDVAPMRPLKRVPILTVEPNGSATIELWCRAVQARVQISDNAMTIEAAPLTETLPQYMSTGQCSDDRMQADVQTLEALTQTTQWQRKGDGVVLSGATQMTFRASSN